MMMAGPLHPPCRRKKFRSVPSPPDGEDSTRSIPSSSPHAAGRAGAPPFFLLEGKEKMGGAMNQPSLVTSPPRPSGRVKTSPDGETQGAPYAR